MRAAVTVLLWRRLGVIQTKLNTITPHFHQNKRHKYYFKMLKIVYYFYLKHREKERKIMSTVCFQMLVM